MFNFELIKKIRLNIGQSQRGAAKEIETTPAALCSWEKGKRIPQIENLLNILKWARKNEIAVSFDDFFK